MCTGCCFSLDNIKTHCLFALSDVMVCAGCFSPDNIVRHVVCLFVCAQDVVLIMTTLYNIIKTLVLH